MGTSSQFVLIAKRILQELRALSQSISAGFLGVQKQIEAVSNASDAEAERQKAPPMIRAELYIPDADKAQNRRTKTEKKWTNRWITVVETGTLAAVVIYVVINSHMLREMRKATEKAGISAEAAQGQLSILQKQLEALDRPWVSIDISVASPLTYSSTSGIQANFNLVPENIGKSPAQNVWIEARLIPSTMGDDVIGIEKNICEHNAAKTRTNMFPGYPIFPGRHYTQLMGLQISVSELESYWAKWGIKGEPPKRYDVAPVTLVGCVDYMFEASPRHHQTGFALDVLMKDRRLVLISKTPLAPESIALVAHGLGGDIVN